jgi:hypothetical protein
MQNARIYVTVSLWLNRKDFDVLRFVKYIPLAVLILIIFISSSMPYKDQTIVPDLMRWLPGEPFADQLSRWHIPYYGMDISVETRGYYYFVEFLVRKLAHITSFGAIAIAMYIALYPKRWRYVLAIVITFLFACIDEFHQYFTSGRSASFQDVLLDTFGGVLWLTIFMLIKRLFKRKKGAPTK